jgi:hypothetical protein
MGARVAPVGGANVGCIDSAALQDKCCPWTLSCQTAAPAARSFALRRRRP